MARDRKSKAAYDVQYIRNHDNIMVRPSKAEGAHIRAAAAEAGQSVQRFILDTLRARIGTPPEDEGTNDTDDTQTTNDDNHTTD